LVFIVGEEGDASVDETIKSDTQRPNIDLLSDSWLFDFEIRVAEFGCEEGWSADSLGEFEIIIEVGGISFRNVFFRFAVSDWSTEIGDSKVGDLDTMILCPEQIRRLDVSVDDAFVMEIL
jgi:hypothetical protein